MEPTQEQTVKTYEIAAVTYRIEPGTFAQHQWLAQGALKGIDFGAGISDTDLECAIQQHGPEILGIVLIEEGQTREQKVEAGLAAAQQLGARFSRQLTPSEVRAMAHDFFPIDGYRNLAYFIDFRALAVRQKAPATPRLLTPASVSLPTETGLGEQALPATADQLRPNSISSEAVSAVPMSGPSLAPVG